LRAFSSSAVRGSSATKTIVDPSPAHSNRPTDVACPVSFNASPPVVRITKIWAVSFTDRVNASRVPSGENAGTLAPSSPIHR
jgi:hypothetical protein